LASGLSELRLSNGAPEIEITLVTQTPALNHDDNALPFTVVRQPGFLRLWRFIRSCDVVHLAGPTIAPLSLALLAGKPVVVEHHGFQTICPNGQLLIDPPGVPCPGHFMANRHSKCLRCNAAQGWVASGKLWLLTFARRLLCARASANITPTQWLGEVLDLPRVTHIPHGLDAAHAILLPAPKSSPPVIAFIGRLVTTKGVPLLFRAAKILTEQNRRFELLIIGDGPERAGLEKLAQDPAFPAKVRFVGRLNGAQLETALAQATVVAVPSLGGEVFGLVVVENMLRALPVVASDLGAFKEVLGDAGLIFCADNPADLAAALSRVVDDPLFAASLGQRARQRAIDFCNRSRMIEAHARLYFAVQPTQKT